MGNPRKYNSPEDFDQMVDLYQAHVAASDGEEHLSWTGLALFLGFCCRADIDAYLKYEGYSYSVKRAKLIVENAYENRLITKGGAGPIFALKNFRWRDTQELDHRSSDKSMSLSDFYATTK